jgi:hypothetical protein
MIHSQSHDSGAPNGGDPFNSSAVKIPGKVIGPATAARVKQGSVFARQWVDTGILASLEFVARAASQAQIFKYRFAAQRGGLDVVNREGQASDGLSAQAVRASLTVSRGHASS